jgi:hypothetical protein
VEDDGKEEEDTTEVGLDAAATATTATAAVPMGMNGLLDFSFIIDFMMNDE